MIDPEALITEMIDGLSYVDESTDPVAIATQTLAELQQLRETIPELRKAALREASNAVHAIRFAKNDPNDKGPDSFYAGVRRAEGIIFSLGEDSPLIACPHWEEGRITMRRGCTACEASASKPLTTD